MHKRIDIDLDAGEWTLASQLCHKPQGSANSHCRSCCSVGNGPAAHLDGILALPLLLVDISPPSAGHKVAGQARRASRYAQAACAAWHKLPGIACGFSRAQRTHRELLSVIVMLSELEKLLGCIQCIMTQTTQWPFLLQAMARR